MVEWDTSGMVLSEKVTIPYSQCRAAVRMLKDNVKPQHVASLFGITREELGWLFVGYLNEEFTL